jgi:thiol-disulfide isomerase/thioredoxin
MFKKLIHDSSNTRRRGLGKWIGLMLAMAAGAAFLTMAPCGCKPHTAAAPAEQNNQAEPAAAPAAAAATDAATQEQRLPRLLDLGAHACIPCKMMAPILDELKKDYADVFKTEFIDVWQNPDAGNQYGIQSIPTQIFFDVDGNEIYRHVGFFSREDILDTWKKHGVDVERK